MTETDLEVRKAEAAAIEAPLPDAGGKRSERLTVIRPSSRLPSLDLGEVWHYRELLGIFVWRDLKVRYKQTFIGVLWAVLQPFLTMIVFTLIFGKFANFPSQDLPYPVFLFSGLLPWTYFASAVTQSSTSVVANVNLVTKVYFPRFLLPFGAVLVPIVDFLLAFCVFLGVVFYFGTPIDGEVWLAPLFMLLAVVTAAGVGLWLSAINVRYRDVLYAVPFLIQIWLFLSPVIYPANAIPEKWQWIYALNPMNTVISGFRWSFFGTNSPTDGQLMLGAIVAVALFVSGLAYFQRSEPRFADTI